jgi:hypothetical protein
MAETTKTTYRQSKTYWELRHVIPDTFRDKFSILDLARLEDGPIASKIPRCLSPLTIGVELEDEAGRVWVVTKVRGYVQPIGSRKKGKAPIAWVKLIEV